ncbi:MAG: protein kinase [Bryobacteraceae bacterium]|nr:protein kinase [Bryobacteraceae bacterium]MDW8377180.1 protein kinase [Bryobacterales bacterium]
MDPERARKAGAIYEMVCEAPEQVRESLLQSECKNDPQLEAEVRRLLKAAQQEQRANASCLRDFGHPSGEQRFYGAYRVTGLLGQGGMGTVYKAERADGQFLRQVAVKVVTGATPSQELHLRFLTERQILAQLDHPHIARLLDGGVTPSGEPYLVMEYVEGEPIDRWCDQRRLTIRQRIQLFLKVLQAVEFAHRQLIVHRDLKPSNVLVDRNGEPRLLDFGTAKILGPEQLGKTQQFLTPRYASPEQLRQQPASVSMDVYSLGVLLYELLTGRWPFGDPQQMNINFARAMGQITATAPSSNTTAEAAAARGLSLRQMRDLLSGDLAFVLLRSLEPDPKLRYGSLRELGQDLERYLQGQPLEARGKDPVYRLGKWVTRNRWLVAASLLVFISLSTGVALREQQRRLALQREAELRALSRYQMFELQDQMAFYGAALPLRQAAAERALQALDRIPVGNQSSAEFRAELAESYARLAEILGNPMRSSLGRAAEAKRALQRALDLAQTLPQGPGFLHARAAVKLQQAMFEFAEAKGTQPLEQARQMLAELRRHVQPERDPPEQVARLATAIGHLVSALRNAGGTVLRENSGEEDLAVAEALIEAAIRREPHRAPFYQTRYALRISQAQGLASKDPERGIAELLRIPTQIDRHPPPISAGRALRYIKAQALCSAGWFQGQAKHYDEAVASLQSGVALFEQIASEDPQHATAQFDLAGCYRTWGFVNEYAGRPGEAVEPLRKALATQGRLLSTAGREAVQLLRAELQIRLAKNLHKTGAEAEARTVGQEGLQSLVELALRPAATVNQLLVAGRYLLDPPPGVANDPRRALEFIERAQQQAPDQIYLLELLSLAAEQTGDWAKALEAAKKRLAAIPEGNTPAREAAAERVRKLEEKRNRPQ